MEVDAIANVADDVPDRKQKVRLETVSKLASLSVKADSTVEHLTPQAQVLARMAAEAKQHRDEDWDIRPHAMLEAAAPTRQQFDEPSTSPVVVMRNPVAGPLDVGGSTELSEPVPFNTDEPIPYESSLFKGTMHLHIRGLENTKEHKFSGKKRFLHIAFQGRFKRDVKASDFWSGHEWFSVSDMVPTSFVNIGYTAAAKMFSSTTRVCPSTSNGQVAGFLNPVLASCQLVNVSKPGQEPDMWEAEEDMRLLSDALTDKNGNPMPAEKRRRWFDSPANAGSVLISKDYVYTWHVWQHWCNISTYRLQLNSLLSFDLCQFSEGQPMQIMAKDQSTGEYSINLLLWHKRLLFSDPPSEAHSLRERLTSGVSSLRASWKGMLASK
uniref:Domain of unknown function at the cortex 1 domain-containing protein n=1 Tax=Tetradesmus obliquus TaxID=3088 RepID=A0A383W1Y2_TETOB|eukprot:jgi/Sobl393_1/18392/SZX71657.1